MPRVALTPEQEIQNAVKHQAESLDLKLYKAHISKKAVADMAGLTRQAVSLQFSRGRLMPEVICAAEILLARKN